MARKRKDDLTNLVAGIYEAALDAAVWPDVVTRITRAAGAQRYALAPILPLEAPPLPVTVHPDVAAPLQAFYSLDVSNPFTRAVTTPHLKAGDVVTRDMLIDDRTWRNSDVYNIVVQPADLDEMAVMAVHCGREDIADRTFLALFRDAGLPPFTPGDLAILHKLSLHLHRAAEISLRLRTRAGLSRAALEALDLIATGTLLVSGQGTILHANAAAEAILRSGDGLTTRRGRLQPDNLVLSGRLAVLIAEASASLNGELPTSGGAMLLPRSSGLPALQLTVAPLAPNSPFDLGPGHAAVLIMIIDPCATVDAPDARLRILFGLTPAESRIAVALANGASPKEIAEAREMSLLTVRTHIRRLHEKFGVRHHWQLLRQILQVASLSKAPRE